jgi:flagellar hook-basal body complex protein FliE
MTVPAVDAIDGAWVTAPAAVNTQATATGFESLLSTLASLNAQALADQQSVASMANGQMDNLHQVLMGMEQTRLGFELMLAVRSKLLDAYQELMRMQV